MNQDSERPTLQHLRDGAYQNYSYAKDVKNRFLSAIRNIDPGLLSENAKREQEAVEKTTNVIVNTANVQRLVSSELSEIEDTINILNSWLGNHPERAEEAKIGRTESV